MYTEAQHRYIESHLRKPEDAIATAEIARTIAAEAYAMGIDVYPEQAWKTALIMNIGEKNKDISFIYDDEYSWKENDKVNIVNTMHGKFSVVMAKQIGIQLTEEQIKAIEGHSQGNYPNDLAQILKIAEICQMTKSPRMYKGQMRDAASSWEEVKEMLEEDKGIDPKFIDIAETSYGRKKFFANNLTYKQKLALFAQDKDILMKIPFVKKFVEKELYCLPPAKKEVASSAQLGKERLAKVLRAKELPKVSEENKQGLDKIV